MDQNLQNPKISIVMATYNRSHLLPRSIRSVLSQSYQNFELIIIDDGSTDGTEERIKSFDDQRIYYLKQNQNQGMSAARNRGFDCARGDYIALLDDDDILLPGALETIVSEFEGLESKGINSPWIWFDGISAENSRVSGQGLKTQGFMSFEDEVRGKIQGDFFVVFKHQLLSDEDRFDPRCWGYEHLLWLKLFRKAKAYYVPKTLRQNYLAHPGRVSSFESQLKHISGVIHGAKTFSQTYGEELEHLSPKIFAEALSTLGRFQIFDGQKAEGRLNLRKSLRYRFSLLHSLLLIFSYLFSGKQICVLASGCLRVKNGIQNSLSRKNSSNA